MVVSGGDAGGVVLHRLATDAPQASSLRMNHDAAVMCLDATDDATSVLSGSVDHTVKQWDLAAGGRCKATFLGHTRSVHCLALAKATPH
eukprot:7242694-Prymnesium_polylepis.1